MTNQRRWLAFALTVNLVLMMLISDVCCWNIRRWRGIIGSRRSRRTQHFPLRTDEMTIHEHFIDLAINKAKQAANRGEVPIGAVIVRNITEMSTDDQQSLSFEVLSMESNRIERNVDASAHAELLALRRAAQRINNWRLLNCTLYSTLECCPMCLSACQAFRIERLVYGAPDLRLGAVETHLRLLDVVHPFHNLTMVIPRLKQEQCSSMMRDFFRQRRRKQSGHKSRAWSQWLRWISFWR